MFENHLRGPQIKAQDPQDHVCRHLSLSAQSQAGQSTITLHQPVSPLVFVSAQNGINMLPPSLYSLDPDPADSYLFPLKGIQVTIRR
jgi:hypothetical protein